MFSGFPNVGSEVVCLVNGDNVLTECLETDSKIAVLVRQTPFYAESGGQAGDIGTMKTEVKKIHFSLAAPLFTASLLTLTKVKPVLAVSFIKQSPAFYVQCFAILNVHLN